MKHIVLFLLLILNISFAYSLDLNVHGDVNQTNFSYDLGLDLVTEESDVYITTGLYRDQKKSYTRMFDSEGLYFGFGKHFMINDNLSVAANAKLYQENNFEKPVYCVRITQILSLFLICFLLLYIV